MYKLLGYVACLSLLTPKLLAAPAPAPQAFGGNSPACVKGKKYQISKQTAFAGSPRLVAGEQCSANVGGCSISDSKTYTVTVTITVGADLGLNIADIVNAGVSSSVSVGKSNAESITTSVTCAAGCTCGLQAIPSLYHVEGTQITYPHNLLGDDSQCVGGEQSAPYAADLPLLVKGGAKNNEAVVRFSACRVAHTFCKLDPGLPLCPEP